VQKNVVIKDSDIAPPPNASAPTSPLHPNPAWPTASGINATEAKRICQDLIVRDPPFNDCSNFTTADLEFVTQSCMKDLQVTYMRQLLNTVVR